MQAEVGEEIRVALQQGLVGVLRGRGSRATLNCVIGESIFLYQDVGGMRHQVVCGVIVLVHIKFLNQTCNESEKGGDNLYVNVLLGF